MTSEEIEKYDKERAARHEAGHLTVALALGCRARAWLIKEASATDNLLDYRVWTGKTQGEGMGTATVAVAGVMAEETDISDWSEWFYLLTDDWECAGLSPTDAQCINFEDLDGLRHAVEAAFSLLTKHGRFFDWAVNELLEYGVVTDGMAETRFADLETHRD